MIKLIIFFRQPANPDLFEERFANHVQLINKMPNVQRTVVNRAVGAPRGEPAYYLIHEVFFTDLAAANYALNAPEGRMAGADLMSFARELTTLLFTEVWGEDPEAEVSPALEAELAAEKSLAATPAVAPAATSVATPVAASAPTSTSSGAPLSTAAAATATALAMAVANAAPAGLAAPAPAAPAPPVAPELDALPTDQEVFGIYTNPAASTVDAGLAESPVTTANAPEAVEAELMGGTVVDGMIVNDLRPSNDLDEVSHDVNDFDNIEVSDEADTNEPVERPVTDAEAKKDEDDKPVAFGP